MQISVQGVLVDPIGNPLLNHEIRITTRVTNIIVEEVVTTLSTDGSGNYSFILNEGWYYVEILLKDTYMVVGDLIVNNGTPTPISLEDLIKYSTPVEIGTINYPPFWQNLIDILDNSPLTGSRTNRDQMVDTLVHVAQVQTTDVSDDGLERKGTYDIDVKSCDAQVTKQSLVYSDDVPNFLASDAINVKTDTITYSNEVIANDELNITGSKVAPDYAETTDITINGIGLTEDRDIDFKGTTYSTTLDVNDDYVATEEVIVTSLGELTRHVSLGNTTYLNSEYLDSSFDNTISHSNSLSTDTYSTTIGSKVTSDTHSNDGTSTSKEVIVDTMIVGRTGNDTFEVDTVNDIVHVRGQFRVSQLQDENGTPIDIEDGDTIFQVSQYSDSVSGPWHDEMQPTDFWRRDNISFNGVVDGNTWGVPYQFRSDTVVGDPGDTIYIEFQYSPDGLTSWTPTLEAGDRFRRERTVTNGVPGPWSDVGTIVGSDGAEIEIRSQYSIDGINLWHDTFVSGDIYERRARFVNGIQDSPWSDPFKMVSNAAFKSTIFKRETGEPDLPVGGDWSNPVAPDWSDGIPAGDLQLWGSTRIFSEDGTSPQQIAWTAVQAMTDTETTDFEYSDVDETPGNPTDNAANWHNIATGADFWLAIRKKLNGVWGVWDISRIKGEDGDDGNPAFKSIVFKRSTSNPGTPTGGDWETPIPSGWSDGIPAGTLQLWSSTRVFTLTGVSPQQAVWTAPIVMTDTALVDFEYSETGIGNPTSDPSEWHNIGTVDDVYMAQQTITNGVPGTWQIVKIKGEAGEDSTAVGIPGLNGSGWYSLVDHGGVWPGDATATADFILEFARAPQLDDHLFYVDQEPNPTQTDGRRCITPAGGGPPVWNTLRSYLEGDVIVKGTLSADRVVANSLTGNEINSQTTIIAGSGSWTAGMNGYDLTNLPAWLGGGANIYKDWRFWSGGETPEGNLLPTNDPLYVPPAPFRVDKNGILTASGANIAGTITIGTSTLTESNTLNTNTTYSEINGTKPPTNANYTYNTNQLSDGAGLGLSASWNNVSGTGKPDDNATANQSDSTTNTAIDTAATTALWDNVANTANAPADSADVTNYTDTRISNSSITNAHLTAAGMYPNQSSLDIKSGSYTAGSVGWAIDSAGTAEFNNVIVRGQLIAGTGSAVDASYISNLVVDTLQIANQAVTVPTRFRENHTWAGSSYDITTINVGTYSGSGGIQVSINGSVLGQVTATTQIQASIQLKANGVNIGMFRANSVSRPSGIVVNLPIIDSWDNTELGGYVGQSLTLTIITSDFSNLGGTVTYKGSVYYVKK